MTKAQGYMVLMLLCSIAGRVKDDSMTMLYFLFGVICAIYGVYYSSKEGL